MNNIDTYLHGILNEGMAENIPRVIKMTTEMLENPKMARQNTTNSKRSVKRPANAYILWCQAERQTIASERPKNENFSSFASRKWSGLSAERKKVYEEKARALRDAHNLAVSQEKQTISIEKPNKNSNHSKAQNSSAEDDWFENMTVTTASDPPFPSF